MTTSQRTGASATRDEDRRRYEAFAGGTALAGFVDDQETPRVWPA